MNTGKISAPSTFNFEQLSPSHRAIALRTDLRQRWNTDQQFAVEQYLEQFPELSNDSEILVELILTEIELREAQGEVVSMDELERRFPNLTESLYQALSVRRNVTSRSGLYSQELSANDNATVHRSIASYEILGELGRGGMGVVYKARQTGLNRLVALKMILHADHASTEARLLFEREAQAIARLKHQNIVQIYEIGEHEEKPFFSLEFVTGGSLDRHLHDATMDAKEAATLVESLAQGIHAAHRAGVIHRDLKPANVLLSEDGTPKITDFGLARTLEESGQTTSGAIMGTPSYMAPEQAAGNSREMGVGTDVYALGAILYECLTGRPPFRGASAMDTILQVVHQPPVAPSQLHPNIPKDLETICLKCLEKQPAQRYQTAKLLAEDLRRFQNNEPINARPISKSERAWRWCKRNPLAALTLLLGSLLLLAIILIPLYIATQQAESTRALAHEQQLTQQALTRANESERAKTEMLWQSHLNQAKAQRVSTLVGQRFESLKAIADAAKIRVDSQLRNEAIAAMALPDIRPSATAFQMPKNVHQQRGFTHQAIAPQTQHAALIGNDRKTVIVRNKEGTLLHTLKHTLKVENLHWRRDGKYLVTAVEGGRTVTVWEMPSARRQCMLEGHQSGIIDLEFSADGNALLTTSYDGSTRIWDPVDGRELLRSVDRTFTGPFSTDNRSLFNQKQTVEFADGRECRILHHGTIGRGGDSPSPFSHGVRECSFSPDGTVLATGTNTSVILWDVASGKPLLQVPGSTGGVAFSTDGTLWVAQENKLTYWPYQKRKASHWDVSKPMHIPLPRAFRQSEGSSFALAGDRRILVATDRHFDTAWVIDTVQAKLLRTIPQPKCFHSAVSHDGRLIVLSSWLWNPPKPMSVYEVKTGRLVHQMTRSPFARSAFSPQGSLLVTGASNHYTFWNVKEWKQLFSIPWKSHLPGQLSFSPDGSHLATIATNYQVQLIDPNNGQSLATLHSPIPCLVSGLRFSPTGTHLAVLTETNRVFLWNLKLIRQQLRDMNLDWTNPVPIRLQ